jgi:S1-C subfamily serine protease
MLLDGRLRLEDADGAWLAEDEYDSWRFPSAVRISSHRHLTGVLWAPDAVVSSEQSLPIREDFEVVLPGGVIAPAKTAGRDPGTNLAVLRLERSISISQPQTAQAHVGELVLAYGSDGNGGIRARLGAVNATGPEWHSQAGGRIDARIVLDIQLWRAEEGGPIFNAAGELLGMSTYGARGEVLVIPTATIARVAPILLREGSVARGWLGLALQPVAVPSALSQAAGQESGMMVMSVAENGPGAAAGLLAGDIVLTIDGVPAVRMRRVAGQLDADSIGRTVEVRLIRGGSVIAVQAVIGKPPAA